MDPEHPWNPLPMEPRGNDNADAVHLAVGKALSAWEGLEGRLAEVFSRLVNAKTSGAIAAYGMITASTGRCDMLEAAYKVSPFQDHEKMSGFLPLLKDVRNFSPRRNEIAHGIVVHYTNHDTGVNGFYLCPASYSTRKHGEEPDFSDPERSDKALIEFTLGKYAYTSKQIDFYINHFGKLWRHTHQIERALSGLWGNEIANVFSRSPRRIR